MFFKQLINPVTALCSYMIADERSHCAVVVDPESDVTGYFSLATDNGFNIRYVILTHFASELVTGHEKLSEASGAEIILSSKATATFEFQPVADNDQVEFGDLRIKFLHTPGHTEESMCLLIYDLSVSDSVPMLLLVGDTLGKGDCGHPDLLSIDGPGSTHMAALLYDSIETKLKHLPKTVKLYPGHAWGSIEASDQVFTSLEQEWQSNFAFHTASQNDFVELITAYATCAQEVGPALFSNRGGQPPKSCTPVMIKNLRPDEILQLEQNGAMIIDFRSVQQFAGGHIRGSINIPAFANLSCLENLLNRPVVIVCNPGEEGQAIAMLKKAGFDSVVGILHAGMAAHDLAIENIVRLRRLTAKELLNQIGSSDPPILIDLRSKEEWSSDGFLNSVHIPFHKFIQQADGLKSSDRVVLYCETEFHSSVCSSLLMHRGFTHVSTLIGGMHAWRRLKSQVGAGAMFVRTSSNI